MIDSQFASLLVVDSRSVRFMPRAMERSTVCTGIRATVFPRSQRDAGTALSRARIPGRTERLPCLPAAERCAGRPCRFIRRIRDHGPFSEAGLRRSAARSLWLLAARREFSQRVPAYTIDHWVARQPGGRASRLLV